VADSSFDLEKHRERLRLVARLQFPARLRAKLDASDVIQETMLQAYEKRDVIRKMGPEQQEAYLHVILANKIRDHQRRFGTLKFDVEQERSLEAALNESATHLQEHLTISSVAPSKRLELDELKCVVADAISELPERQRIAVELRKLQGLSLKECACQMGVSTGAVAGLYQRGIRALTVSLKRLVDDEFAA
jgi:RNA polymerase sigma-70 factor (ECF subfamily)